MKVASEEHTFTAISRDINHGNLDRSNDPRLLDVEYLGNFVEELEPLATDPLPIIMLLLFLLGI
jgi:hypothetical protein